MTIWHYLTYFAAAWFVAMVIYRIVKIASAPVHLRWELYPVPHEKGRAAYGGSRLEETDWWTKPQGKDMVSEVTAMGTEIVFLKGVWEHNKNLWIGSFPFHFGLYIFMVNTVLILLGGILQLSGTPVFPGAQGFAGLLSLAIVVLGWAGAILGIVGSVILLFKRLFNSGLSAFATASHYFNIILIGALFVSAFTWLATDTNIVQNMTGFSAGLFSASAIPDLPLIGYIDLAIALFFVAYLPLTHMTHLFTKYFTYHKVRWEDAPNVPGSKMADRIAEQLNQPVSWAAPHIGADGRKNWIAIASSMPGKEARNGKA